MSSSSLSSSSLSAHYVALCGDRQRNRLGGKIVKASRSMVGLLDALEGRAEAQCAAERVEKGDSSSPSTRCASALFGRCPIAHLPIIGSTSRQSVVRAASEAKVPTVSYSTDYCLDLSSAYIGTAGCVVLCEALLTYVPEGLVEGHGGGAASGEATATAADGSSAALVAAAPPLPSPTSGSQQLLSQSSVIYSSLKELRLATCGLDTNAAYALFNLLTSDRCAFTLKVLDVRGNPYLGLEAGQLFLGAMGYVLRDPDGSGGERSGADLLALLRSLAAANKRAIGGDAAVDSDDVCIPNLVLIDGDGVGAESHTGGSAPPSHRFRTFDIGTQTNFSLENTAAGAKGGGDGDENDDGAGDAHDPDEAAAAAGDEDAAARVAKRRAARDERRRAAGFRSRPKAPPNRTIARLCTLSMEGTNIPPHYMRRLEALCEQNRHL